MTTNKKELEMVLREWLRQHSSIGEFDYWELDDDDLPILAAALADHLRREDKQDG